MSHNTVNMYDIDSRIAAIHDKYETQRDDVKLIRRLIDGMGKLRILEPFCGTGRILVPLAEDGHEMVGFDQAEAMLDSAQRKLVLLPAGAGERVTLFTADATEGGWPSGFDLVILGGNCFYELSTPEEQEGCIASAAASLKPGGYLYLDNNHMEGELDESWREIGNVNTKAFPSGTCDDGTIIEATSETIWFDAPRRLWKAKRTARFTFPDGTTEYREWVQQKHPVSVVEQKEWLDKHGFDIVHLFGDRSGNAYTDASGRGIFWARK